MTPQFQELLNVLSHSVFGNEYVASSEVKAGEIYSLSVKQGVFPLVYPVVSEKNPCADIKKEMLFS